MNFRPGSLAHRMLDVLQSSDTPLAVSELAVALGVDPKRASNAAFDLYDAGAVDRYGARTGNQFSGSKSYTYGFLRQALPDLPPPLVRRPLVHSVGCILLPAIPFQLSEAA